MRPGHIVVSLLAILCLLYPAVSLFCPVPAYPTNLFPYIFIVYMLIGITWLFVVHRRSPDKITEIERDLESIHCLFGQPEPSEASTPDETVSEIG